MAQGEKKKKGRSSLDIVESHGRKKEGGEGGKKWQIDSVLRDNREKRKKKKKR